MDARLLEAFKPFKKCCQQEANDLHQVLTPVRVCETQERAILKLESEVLKKFLAVPRNSLVSERTTPDFLEEPQIIAPHNLEGPQRMILHKLKAPEGMTPNNLEAPERILSRNLEAPERIVPHTLIQWKPNRSRFPLDHLRRNQIPVDVHDFIFMSRRTISWYC
ncbi:uncharacterized protein BJ212DRAFT_848347 [Suillus subaureus]|uniref:Uncharacterized protein n=1 Tax=Suillus subaureus TaxID=48587 RepID=A0A9P7DXQ5_9AGAM|nr:uncharacterized protein BJ212DRAFT_848347 [Suillus subaureus]KAG1805648.1 hypothetical protein BJ212DRAFT_848347 [Suillus subaureus]